MKLTVAWIGKTKEAAFEQLTQKYLKRLAFYSGVEGLEFKDESRLLKLAGRDGRSARSTLILLDGRGKQLSSEEFAAFLGAQQQQSSASLVFAIGPADGFTDQILKSADFTISLGKMTFAHELARVVLLEQLYRAFTILKGHPYHLGH